MPAKPNPKVRATPLPGGAGDARGPLLGATIAFGSSALRFSPSPGSRVASVTFWLFRFARAARGRQRHTSNTSKREGRERPKPRTCDARQISRSDGFLYDAPHLNPHAPPTYPPLHAPPPLRVNRIPCGIGYGGPRTESLSCTHLSNLKMIGVCTTQNSESWYHAGGRGGPRSRSFRPRGWYDAAVARHASCSQGAWLTL